MTQRERQEPKSRPECRELTGAMDEKKRYEKTGKTWKIWKDMKRQVDRQARHLWMWKPGSSKHSGGTCHLVFWPWTHTLTLCVRVLVYAEQLKRKPEDRANQCLQIHNKFLSIYLFIFSLAAKETTANLQGVVVARGWIMAILIWLCKSSEEPKARYRNIS